MPLRKKKIKVSSSILATEIDMIYLQRTFLFTIQIFPSATNLTQLSGEQFPQQNLVDRGSNNLSIPTPHLTACRFQEWKLLLLIPLTCTCWEGPETPGKINGLFSLDQTFETTSKDLKKVLKSLSCLFDP